MSDENTPANSLTTAVNQTGLPNSLKGKVQKVILRMLAGGVAHPYVRQIRNNLDEMDGRSKVNMMLAEEVGRQAIADPHMVERAKARFLGDLYKRQENLEAVAGAAQTKLNEFGSGSGTSEQPGSEPSDDWMNAFSREAESASSEQLRERLANLLVNEIRNPGTYSRATIRLVSEIDRVTLEEFMEILKFRVGKYIIRDNGWNEGRYFFDRNEFGRYRLDQWQRGLHPREYQCRSARPRVLYRQRSRPFLRGYA